MPLQHYGNTEGPLGFPMIDKQARALELLLKTLPKTDEYKYRHAVQTRTPPKSTPVNVATCPGSPPTRLTLTTASSFPKA